MNTFVNRFSTTSAVGELRKLQTLADEGEEFSDAMWGSEAGFGSLAKGVPTFSVPAVADVSTVYYRRLNFIFLKISILDAANLIFEIAYRRPCRPKLQDQNPTRNYYTCF
jgi:hypothetical protein